MVIRMCTLSATANVMMTIVASTEIGSSLTPTCPATPTATTVENRITSSVAAVPLALRNASAIATRRTRYMLGIRVMASPTPTSAKALLSMETPVMATVMSGYVRSISAAISRATATASGTSASLFSGYCRVTLIPVAPRLRATSLPKSNGSAMAISRF